jgi:hypothetical protein
MNAKRNKTAPTWNDIKAKLIDFERSGFLGLIQDLYGASKENQSFLHTRFGLGGDVLKPYKATLERWLSPDMYRDFDTSVAKAKRAIADYRKAIGEPEGMVELMVYYCERATEFSSQYGLDDQSYAIALIRMFERALKASAELPAPQREAMRQRLDAVTRVGRKVGYGVGEEMTMLFVESEEDD